MRAIVNTGPGVLELCEVPIPAPDPGQVLIRTAFCGICVTDLQMIAGWERTGFPSIPGHEWSGVVEAVGSQTDAHLVGRPCVAENVLSDGSEVGFEHPGGYSELFLTEARNLLTLPASLDLAVASLVEPLAVCLHALKRLARTVGADEPVLVIGDGAIGLLLVMVLSDRGCRNTTLVGGRAARLELAGQLGVTRTLNYHEMEGDQPNAHPRGGSLTQRSGRPCVRPSPVNPCNVFVSSISKSSNRKFPVVLEASGSPEAADACMDLVEQLGTIVVIGDYGPARASFPWNSVLHRQMTIVGSNASAGTWPEAMRLSSRLPLTRLISRRIPASHFEEGIALVKGKDPSVVKVLLSW